MSEDVVITLVAALCACGLCVWIGYLWGRDQR
jgi:hypothetical protein